MKPSIEQLKYECARVRNAAHSVYEEKSANYSSNAAEFPAGWCGVLSRVLSAILSQKYPEEKFYYVCGIKRYHNGRRQSHAWVRYRDWILDITADQFAEITDPIVIVRYSESSFHSRFEIEREYLVGENIDQYDEERAILQKYAMKEI